MIVENIIEICVAIDIAILGIAYPIIIDKISNIGEKYSSQYISILFENEFPQLPIKFRLKKRSYQIAIFKLTLYLTLITFLFIIFNEKPLFGWNNWFINNSAKLIVLTSSILLTAFFLIWLDKVLLYNGKSTTLLKRLISKYNTLDDETEIKQYHLKSINELTYYAIQKQDEHLQKTLLEFYSNEFSLLRKNHDRSIPLIYTIDLYFFVRKLNEELINNVNRKLPAIEHRAVSGSWLLGEDFEEITISETTYNWLWGNLYVICDNEKYVKMYWANVSQYFDLNLRYIPEDHEYGGEILIVKNKIQVDKRDKERNEFLEFHYALGGLLLYRKQYNTLNYIFEYSQSQPPQYPLLPHSMAEIFKWFENFRNEFRQIGMPLDIKYYFPELDNLGNRRKVNFWICSYICLLFIRQYTLQTYYVYQNHTQIQSLPDDVLELNNWLESASYFEKCLKELIKNEDLFIELEWSDLVKEKKSEFEKFIYDLKESIKDKIGAKKLNAQLSPDKVEKFKISSNEILSNTFRKYSDIFTSISTEQIDEELKMSIVGVRTLLSKSAFTDDDIPNLNYDTIVAEQQALNIERFFAHSFFAAKTKRYLFNKENIIYAIEKITEKTKDIVIISININYEIKQVLNQSIYKPLIKDLPGRGVNDVLFVLKKSDLPGLEHKEIEEEEKLEYKLEQINEQYKIYASVIDINLHENSRIKEKWLTENSDDSLNLKVQVAISFIALLYWKKNRSIIQINIASRFKEEGIQNDLKDIETF